MPFRPSSRYYQATQTAFYDPSIRDYAMNDSGLTEDVHPTDQRMALLLSTLEGKIAGDPTMGYKSPGFVGSETAKKLTQRAVLVCVDPAVSDGDVSIEDIQVTFPKRGETNILVIYRNLLLEQSRQIQKARVSFGGS